MLRRIMAALALTLLVMIASPVQAQKADDPQAANEADVYYKQGLELYKKNQFKEATEAFKQAVKLKANHAEAYYELGRTYEALGQEEEARKAYKEAARLKPELTKMHKDSSGGYDDMTMQKEAAAERNRATGRLSSDSVAAEMEAPGSSRNLKLLLYGSIGIVLIGAVAFYFLRRRAQAGT